jgi:hypothetical protein
MTQVTDQAAIDLDQLMIEDRAFVGDFVRARNVYEEGGHSLSYAHLTLLNVATDESFPVGTVVLGLNERGQNVTGILMESLELGDVIVKVLYDTSDVQASHVRCTVGGLSTFGAANRDGCTYHIF